MLRNKQTHPPKKEARHWSQQVQENVVASLPGQILTISIKGGADNGLFCYLGDVKRDKVTHYNGKLHNNDIILQIQGKKVVGYTLRDCNQLVSQAGQNGTPVMIKTVKPGELKGND